MKIFYFLLFYDQFLCITKYLLMKILLYQSQNLEKKSVYANPYRV